MRAWTDKCSGTANLQKHLLKLERWAYNKRQIQSSIKVENMPLRHHPRRPGDSQLGQEKRRDESFQVRAKEPLGTDTHRTISKNLSRCRLLIGHTKCFVLLCPISGQFLLSSFREFVRDRYCLDHGLSVSCTREMYAFVKLSVWHKVPIWFQNTVCTKTKDAFPKRQAWVYNRYSRLHRSRLA